MTRSSLSFPSKFFGAVFVIYCQYYLYFFSIEGVAYTQQSYKVSDVFPFKWINKKWKEGFSVTSMTTAGSKWGIVMSRNAGYPNQVVQSPILVFHFGKSTAKSTYVLYCILRLLNLTSSIQVKGFIEDGRMDIGSPQLLLQQIKLHSYLVLPRGDHQMLHKKL